MSGAQQATVTVYKSWSQINIFHICVFWQEINDETGLFSRWALYITTIHYTFYLFNQEGLIEIKIPGQDRQHQVITKKTTDRQDEKLQVI